MFRTSLWLSIGCLLVFCILSSVHAQNADDASREKREAQKAWDALVKAKGECSECKITGRVVDQNDLPVSGVMVSCSVYDRPARGTLSTSRTDDKGNFVLTRIEPGENAVYTEKPADGYASTQFGMIGTSRPPIVTVDGSHPEVYVEIKLGPRSPRLTGTVTDAQTGKPVKDARYIMRRVDDSEIFQSGSIGADGKFDLLTPLGAFTFQISSPGHRDWQPGQTGNPKIPDTPMILSTDSINELNISLERK